MANAIFSLFGMTRVSHHVNFPKAALSKGGRGQRAMAAPAALHAMRTPWAAGGHTGRHRLCVCVSPGLGRKRKETGRRQEGKRDYF